MRRDLGNGPTEKPRCLQNLWVSSLLLGEQKSHLEQRQHASLPSQHKGATWMKHKGVESQEGKGEGVRQRTIVKTRGNAPWRRDWRRVNAA